MTWVVERGDGDVHQTIAEPGSGAEPDGMRKAQTPRMGLAGEVWDWIAGAWVVSVAWAEADALARVDGQRRARMEAAMTYGSPIAMAYAAKAGEVHAYETLGGAAVAMLAAGVRRERFTYLMAEVDAGGGTLAEVVARVKARMVETAAIDAIAVVAKRTVRAATTAEAKQAAADIDWGTT